jgi:electron transport complex protein RnfE
MAEKKKAFTVLLNGLLNENPTFRLLLGMCPSLAVTTMAKNGLGMGAAATFVLVGSNLVAAFLPELNKQLGIYIPLIVVNCIIFARAEMFAQKNGPVLSVLDGIGMGAGFTIAITVIGSVREILGAGTWMGIPVTVNMFEPAIMFILPPGGFLAMGFLVALFNKLTKKKKEDNGECETGCGLGCPGCSKAANGGEA